MSNDIMEHDALYKIKGHFVELLNYKIYSEDGTISAQKPVIVFLHGLGGGYSNWVYQVRYLKKKYDLLLIELPSHGRKKFNMSELELNFDTVSKKIMEVVDHLGIDKATFAGISVGTLIVKHIAFTYPERVDKYILVGPVGKFTLLLKTAIRLTMFLLPILPLKLVLTLVCLVVMPYKSLAYGRNLFLNSARRVAPKEFVAWCKVLLSFPKIQKDYVETMKEEPNGLYVVGELDHFFLTMLKSDMKRVKNLAIVKNAGHICSIDQYEAVNDLIIEFQETGTVKNNKNSK